MNPLDPVENTDGGDHEGLSSIRRFNVITAGGCHGFSTKDSNPLITILNRSHLIYRYQHVQKVHFYDIGFSSAFVIYVI